jgi:O-antigen/teichoic acid export membrane protein
VFLDLGVTQILIRETARNKSQTENYLSNIIGFKLVASLFLYAIIILVINLMGYPEMTRELVYVSGLVMLVDSLTLSVYGAIRGRQNLSYESIGTVGNQSIVLIIGGALLLLKVNPVLVMAVYLLSSLSNLLWSIFNLKRKFGVVAKIVFNWSIIKTLILWSLPFALAGIFSRIFSSTDIILLSKLSDDRAVGIYSAAFKVAFALQFIALAFSASIYPAFSAYFAQAKDKLSQLFVKSMFWLMFVAGPLVFGVIAVADPAIVVIFGHQYADSILPLQILIASMLFAFLCFPIGAMLNACDKQTRHTVNLGITAAGSVVFNLILIPIYSYNGAAIANLLCYVLLFVLGIGVVGRIIKYDWKFLLWSFIKIIFACLVMFAAMWLIKTELNFILAIIAGIVVYFVMVYVLRLFTIQAVKEFLKSIRKNQSASPPEEELV